LRLKKANKTKKLLQIFSKKPGKSDPAQVLPLLSGLLGKGLEWGINVASKTAGKVTADMVRKTAEELNVKLEDMEDKAADIPEVEMATVIREEISKAREKVREIAETHSPQPSLLIVLMLMVIIALLIAICWRVFRMLFDWLIAWMAPLKPVTFQEGLEHGKRFLFIIGSINTIGSMFALLGDVEIFGCRLSGRELGRALTNFAWTFGIGWLQWIVMGPPLHKGIAEPVEKGYLQLQRPMDLPRSEWEEALRRMNIGWDRFKQQMAKEGYPDDQIDLLGQNLYKLLSVTDIYYAFEKRRIKIDEAVQHLKRLGFRDRVLELVKQEGIDRAIEDEYKRWIREVEADYIKGFATEAELRKEIEISIDPERQIDWMVHAIQRRADRELNELWLRVWEEAFKDKEIDEERLRELFSTIIVRPEVLEARIAMVLQKVKRPERIEPVERLAVRRRRLEARAEGLRKQIQHQRALKQEQVEAIETQKEVARRLTEGRKTALKETAAMRKKVIQAEFEEWGKVKREELESRIEWLGALHEARIEAILETLSAFETATVDRISSRIRHLRATLKARKEAMLDELAKWLEKPRAELEGRRLLLLREATIAPERAKLLLLARIEVLEIMIPLPMEKREAEVRKRILMLEATTMARIEALERMAEVRIAERRTRVADLIRRMDVETVARIRALEEMAMVAIAERRARVEAMKARIQIGLKAGLGKAGSLA